MRRRKSRDHSVTTNGGIFTTHLVPFGSMLVSMSSTLAFTITDSAVAVVALDLAEVESPVWTMFAGIGTG